jgi:hypothetical protein
VAGGRPGADRTGRRQRLLETDPLDRRLWLLSSLLDEEIDVLVLRAAEG